jgi:predicted nucleic-acid-binding protein
MLAIDTNVVVRYLTGDDPVQSPLARALIDSNDIYVSRTVMLESDWVLRSAYGFAPAQVSAALRAFAGLPRVSVEGPALLALALDRAEGGMNFADALHLGAAESCEALVTFDRKLVATAKALGVTGIRLR